MGGRELLDATSSEVKGRGNLKCKGRCFNIFLGLPLRDRTILFVVISLDKTASFG